MPCHFPVHAYVVPNRPAYSFFVVVVVDIIYNNCLFFFSRAYTFAQYIYDFFPWSLTSLWVTFSIQLLEVPSFVLMRAMVFSYTTSVIVFIPLLSFWRTNFIFSITSFGSMSCEVVVFFLLFFLCVCVCVCVCCAFFKCPNKRCVCKSVLILRDSVYLLKLFCLRRTKRHANKQTDTMAETDRHETVGRRKRQKYTWSPSKSVFSCLILVAFSALARIFSKLRRLWPNVPRQVACELVTG